MNKKQFLTTVIDDLDTTLEALLEQGRFDLARYYQQERDYYTRQLVKTN